MPMSEWYKSITPQMKQFIGEQKVFFVATAPIKGRINLSPKGMDSFRVLDPHHVIYLDLTGSGNETAAHLLENGRITIMFCSFDKTARIMRLYGRGRAINPHDSKWGEYLAMFPAEPGVRQIMEIEIETAMISCGYGVPLVEGLEERDTLRKYWQSRDAGAVVKYQRDKNLESIDGLPTGIFAEVARNGK
jgi:hypothetical protein